MALWQTATMIYRPFRLDTKEGGDKCRLLAALSCADLALGVLRCLAGALEAVLLALLHASVTREQTVVSQLRLQRLVEADQRPCDTVRDGSRPAADAAPFHLG